MRGRPSGFTLLEVLAVVMLTAVVIGMALDFYLDLSRDTLRATHFTRDIRRATAILDRVARDFQRTVLLAKAPSEDDPLDAQPVTYSRLVPLPLRPFAREALVGEGTGGTGDGEEGEGDTDANGDGSLDPLRALLSGGDPRATEKTKVLLNPRAPFTGED